MALIFGSCLQPFEVHGAGAFIGVLWFAFERGACKAFFSTFGWCIYYHS
jgi:hypothetical protein